MELRQLKCFIQVATLRSFTKASAVLDVSQPALSRIVRDLELELGVSLLVRTGRGATLTEAGIKLLDRARLLVEDAERTFQEMRSLKGRPMGLVSIGMPPSIGTMLAVPLIERMRASFSEIELQLTEGYSGHINEWLLSGRLDIGVLYIPKRSHAAKDILLAAEKLYLLSSSRLGARYLGSSPAVDFSALIRLPLILPARPHAIRKLIDDIAVKRRLQFDLHLEVNAFLTIRDLVVQSHGFTILPASSVLPDLAAGRLQATLIQNPQITQDVGVMTSPHHPTSLAAKTVVGLVQQTARDLIRSGAWPQQYENGGGARSKARERVAE